MWNKIQELLTQRGMSAYELSKAAGYDQTGIIYRLKNGAIKKPSFELMERIADALGVSMDEFRKKEEQ
ncbi:helix-turn-helix domain-containing protein [Lacticaseibacillus hulanensis]|uniref:helix-turn-helix domain-containing protein n=1 Tax=Lacticaseibacillus hulanensis TaxID=2493111 RepID=UPI000FD80819|nr:helix-turn-helix transcriptional regulator [Lacticaseibacillus hulanensis]